MSDPINTSHGGDIAIVDSSVEEAAASGLVYDSTITAAASSHGVDKPGGGQILDEATLIHLQAAAFRSLCRHLEERSDLVSNMDLMSVSGFCRNCLAKWMVLEARRMVDTVHTEIVHSSPPTTILNDFGYEQAAELVYGMSVATWKERHQIKATPEQMERYQASSNLHAMHNAEYLAVRANGTSSTTGATVASSAKTTPAAADITIKPDGVLHVPVNIEPSQPSTAALPLVRPTLSSNVCCQGVEDDDDDDDDVATVNSNMPSPHLESQMPAITATISTTPPIHTDITDITALIQQRVDLSILPRQQFPVTAILTVSDRAFAGLYETGDLSGPSVIASIQSLTGLYDLDFVTVVVPDDSAAIQAKLKILSNQGVELILTTGGTGFSPRDVTPEATLEAIDSELTSLMPWVATAVGLRQEQAYHHQQQQQEQRHGKPWPGPTTTLSRGTAGILHSTIVANLPGSPQAVTEIMPVLLPLLLQAVAELHLMTPEIFHIG